MNRLLGFKYQPWGVRWFSYWTRSAVPSYGFLKCHYILSTLLYSSRQSAKPMANCSVEDDKSNKLSVLFKQIK